jgi:hypothetical protein
MTDEASGPTWLKLGGLLSGIAALLTAIVAAVALVVDIWPDRSVQPPETAEETLPDAAGDAPAKPPTPTTAAVNLVRYEADGCFYAVELLESGDADRRVRFPFNLAASVPADDIQPAHSDPSALQRGMTVFVPGDRANPQAQRQQFYKLAIVDDVLGSIAHVRFEQEDQCPVDRELLALPVSELLVATR